MRDMPLIVLFVLMGLVGLFSLAYLWIFAKRSDRILMHQPLVMLLLFGLYALRGRQMKPRQFSMVLQSLGAAGLVITSGCATAFVRSKNTVDAQHVYPATAFDGQMLWKAGVKGEPLFASVDPKDRSGCVTRITYGFGAIIDLPVSIVFDTVLLPLDLTRSSASAEDRGTKDEPGGAVNPTPATVRELDRSTRRP